MLIYELILYNYHRKWCQILELWFPLMGRAFFETPRLMSVARFPHNPAGEILLYSVYIISM
jgi:hypothetical protein